MKTLRQVVTADTERLRALRMVRRKARSLRGGAGPRPRRGTRVVSTLEARKITMMGQPDLLREKHFVLSPISTGEVPPQRL